MNHITKTNVPILDEHILFDEEGKELAHIDESRLKKIAALANQRVRDTGDMVPIIIGHTKDNTDEEEQPEIVGYASNFKVSKFFKTGRKALTATFKFFKKYLSKIRKYPRRSIELWLNDWKIDPISLLGATTPERDLGLLKLSKGGVRKLHIVYKDSAMKTKNRRKFMMENDQNKEIVDAVLQAFKQTDVYKWACQKMQEEEGAGEEGEMGMGDEMEGMEGMEGDEGMDEGGGMPGGGDEALGEEGEAEQGFGEEPEAGPEEEEGKEPMRYSTGASAASGTNTYTPEGAKNSMLKKAKMQKLRTKAARQEAQLTQAIGEIQGLKLKYRKAEREKDLLRLEAEGMAFDLDEELEDVADMPEKLYQRHLAKIKTRYSKAPIGQSYEGSAFANSRTSNGPVDKAQLSNQAVELATQKGISFSEALDLVGGGV